MRARLALLAVVGAGVLAAPGPTAGAGTAPPDALGWWTRRPDAGSLGETGGFEIASSLRGDESIAAVRVTLADGATQPRLVLTEVPGVAAAEGAAFQACPATSPWEPADAGAWEARPGADCDDAVQARRVDPEHWAVDLAPLAGGAATSLDVVLVPTPTEVVPGVPTPPTFTLTFAAIELVTTDASSGGSSGTVAPPVPPPTSGSPSVSPSVAPSPAVTPRPLPTSRPATPPTTAAPSVEEFAGVLPPPDDAGGTGAIAAPTFDLVDSSDGRPWWRLALLIPLSAVIGIGAAAARTSLRTRTV